MSAPSPRDDRRAPIAAGLILAAVALLFVVSPRIVAWADGSTPGLGIYVGFALAALMMGGFVGVFWLRGRSARDGDAEQDGDAERGER